MAIGNFSEKVGFIWSVADLLRGPYRPNQYKDVMLPLTVLRRLDCVLEPTKEAVLARYDKLKGGKVKNLEPILNKVAGQSFHNTSKFTFAKLKGDPTHIAANLTHYIKGFSPRAREILEHFGFEEQIGKLDKADRLYLVVSKFCDIDLHPNTVSNLEMGYIFEELIRRFNEASNEEAGDHFTPREVIRLMVNLLFNPDSKTLTQKGAIRTLFDPTAGTGGMLSVSEEYLRELNPDARLEVFGQDYNAQAYAICGSDMMIKGHNIDHIQFGNSFTEDHFRGYQFDYMLANPPFGVEWKPEQKEILKEHQEQGYGGRFGPGLPRINDGATLFLLHMLNKMKPAPEQGGEGSKIAVIFNGSPLFNGEPGPSESNIRRWIIENDWLDAIIALPDQLFYNTGIYTYIWLVSNRKPDHRKGRVQLIDGTRHFRKMKKSLGNKRNELGDEHIEALTRLYAEFEDGARCRVGLNGELVERVCSRTFDNREFGYLKVTVERPLRLNFQASPERIDRLAAETAFANLAKSKKRKNAAEAESEVKAGQASQQRIIEILEGLDPRRYSDRAQFEPKLKAAFKQAGEKLPAPIKKAILNALSERDPVAAICRDAKGNPEPDTELRDTEIVPLPADIPLPLPIGYEKDADNAELLALVRDHCEDYLAREVLPFVDDAWIDHAKTKVGYEIPINRHFYVYEPPRPLEEIEQDIQALESEILAMLKKVTT